MNNLNNYYLNFGVSELRLTIWSLSKAKKEEESVILTEPFIESLLTEWKDETKSCLKTS